MGISKTTLVTGACGLLGNGLKELAPTSLHKCIFADVDERGITSNDTVRAMFEAEKPDWVVNCAAYTAVDKAESDVELARKLNATVVEILADEATKVGDGIVHISTDNILREMSKHLANRPIRLIRNRCTTCTISPTKKNKLKNICLSKWLEIESQAPPILNYIQNRPKNLNTHSNK